MFLRSPLSIRSPVRIGRNFHNTMANTANGIVMPIVLILLVIPYSMVYMAFVVNIWLPYRIVRTVYRLAVPYRMRRQAAFRMTNSKDRDKWLYSRTVGARYH